MYIKQLSGEAELAAAYEQLRYSPMGSLEREGIEASIKEYENDNPWNEGDEGDDC